MCILALAIAAIGCGDSPVAPAPKEPLPNPAIGPLAITTVTPRVGPSDRSTGITGYGTRFGPGTTLTIGGVTVPVVVKNEWVFTAVAPPHDPGSVDIVMSNPDGQTARIDGGFVYMPAVGPPAPVPTFSINPKEGRTDRTTQVSLFGSAIREGVTVTIAGERVATTSSANPNAILAYAPPHPAGPVDVVVTTVDGQITRLAGGFTYVPPPPLALNYLSPDAGSTSGGTGVFLSGVSFQSGAIVTVDGVPAGAHFNGGAGYFLTTEPHAAGAVQIIVTNPDGGVSNPLTYTFAPPESFDFNGTWESYSGETEEPDFVFTIQNNQLLSMTCRGGAPNTFAPAPAITGGAFGFTLADGSRMAGRVVAAVQARGDMSFPVCGAIQWTAYKRQ